LLLSPLFIVIGRKKVSNILPPQRLGKLRIQKKIILNKDNPDYLEVVIGEIEVVKKETHDELHYIISSGGTNKIRIIGKENWTSFLEMVQWLDWDPDETQDVTIPKMDEYSNTYVNIPKTPKTLELEIPDIDDEIIDGIPIDD